MQEVGVESAKDHESATAISVEMTVETECKRFEPATKAGPCMNRPSINVAQPFLPPLEEFVPLLNEIWANRWLTNNGPFHQALEQSLCDYLGVPYVCLFANATIALITALQAIEVSGEVITTPYSFVATSHSLMWNNVTPVFADIDPVTFNLDPRSVEAAITTRTSAILPVHCYGQPCDHLLLNEVARKRSIPIVYDAAHAFGVALNDRSILLDGDLSVLSFHATKVFNTFEGGAIICPSADMKRRIDLLKNFGFVDEQTIVAAGLNGKMNEVSAAFGLLQLKHVKASIEHRRNIDAKYRTLLAGVDGITVPRWTSRATPNYAYFPVLIERAFGATRDQVHEHCKATGVMTRRYFFPLISDTAIYAGLPSSAPDNVPVAQSVANRVLCLPIHTGVTEEDVERIVETIKQSKAICTRRFLFFPVARKSV